MCYECIHCGQTVTCIGGLCRETSDDCIGHCDKACEECLSDGYPLFEDGEKE